MIRCPYCDSERAERIAGFGSALMTSQHRCGGCGAMYEAVRWGAEPEETGAEQPGAADGAAAS
jgi:DNA-directed RNA polymerase subunit RPC12/RpoP